MKAKMRGDMSKYRTVVVEPLKVLGRIELPVERVKAVKIKGAKPKKVKKVKGVGRPTRTISGNGRLNTLYWEWGGACAYCGCQTRLPERWQTIADPDTATIEHVYPKTDIRRHLSEETILACYSCNYSKGLRDFQPIDQWHKERKIIESELSIIHLLNSAPSLPDNTGSDERM